MPVLQQAGQLSALEWLAVKIVGRDADKRRHEVEPGKAQPVDLLLRIQGNVDVANDGSTTTTDKPTAEHLLAFLLSKMTTEQQSVVDGYFADLVSAMKQQDPKAPVTLPDVKEGHVAMAHVMIEAVTHRTKSPKRGTTKGQFNVGLVELGKLSASVNNAVKESTRAISLEDV